jgi:predicted esterase
VPRRDSPSADDIRFTYDNNQVLEREVDAAIAALGERFADHADLDRIVYTGFSLGAIMGVAIFGRGTNAARYPRAALVEGGHDRWTAASAKKYAEGGGRRVLFGCGQPSCVQAAKRASAFLEKAGVATRVVHGKNMGHTYDGAVAAEVRTAIPWLLEGDDRFGAPPAVER